MYLYIMKISKYPEALNASPDNDAKTVIPTGSGLVYNRRHAWNFALNYENLINFKIITMKTGTVKFYNETKGFGFIKDADSPNEYYVGSSGLTENIKDNDKVSFELEKGTKGLNAVNVKPI